MMEEELKGTETSMWLPAEVGEEIIGMVVEVREGKYGKQWRIQNEQLKLDCWTPSHKVLQNRMAKANIEDCIRIKYVGEEDNEKGNPTNLYRVFRQVKEEKV